jgi:7-cyano-7-deazaguanine synthase
MKAVVLLSGGLDSATTLAAATQEDYECYALSFRYGQRHAAELDAARRIAGNYKVKEHRTLDIDLATIGGSALTDHSIEVPVEPVKGIPVTYVPARNTIFLSFALGYAEVISARHIFIGVNAVDYSGYPDCRPEFISAFQHMANLATRASVEGAAFRIHTPLIELSKAGIISLGARLGVDYSITVSCYQADDEGLACGKCESCRIRKTGFAAADVRDPTRYRN